VKHTYRYWDTTAVGKTKYFSPNASVWMPVICFTLFFIESSQLALKKMADFGMLTIWPDPLYYVKSISLNLLSPLMLTLVNIRQSSTNKWEIHEAWMLTQIPLARKRGHECLRRLERPSAQMRKR
jgi:hypothetical protein